MRDLIDALVRETGTSTAEALRRAVSIYAVLIDGHKSGKVLQLVGKDGTKETLRLIPLVAVEENRSGE